MRPRLRRLVSWWRGIPSAQQNALPPAEQSAAPPPESAQDGGDETERRIEDARQRLKRSVPPREDL
ncbi:MAG TPA: hypothetical protein VH279_09110 [Solirubrobacteraceae bacterium]|nr:hypothetical protein [Solirubrobacteraceae bacterium]